MGSIDINVFGSLDSGSESVHTTWHLQSRLLAERGGKWRPTPFSPADSLPQLPAAGPVTVAGRLAEAPPTAYLNQTSPEPA